MKRCAWCNENNPKYIHYHDHVWGVPVHDDRMLFEMLVLEGAQAGLSWETILNRQENYEKAFDGFDVETVASYSEEKTQQLMNDAGIIRNRGKIMSAVNNAKVFLKIQKEFGSFGSYLWKWTDGKVIYETGRITSELSDAISKDLKKRGMNYCGSVIMYSYLQAVGVIYGHEEECDLWRDKQ